MRLLILLIIIPISLQAQSFKVSSAIEMEVIGTSTLHDWEMVSDEGMGSAVLKIEDGLLTDITSLSFKIKTETLKSGKSAMDKISYESMKTDDHEYITFTLNDIKSINKNGTEYTIDGSGNLTIAGYKKPVKLRVNGLVSSSKITFTGEYKMKMTEYEIEPPTAMFGAIKTGDDLTIKFKVSYSTNSNF